MIFLITDKLEDQSKMSFRSFMAAFFTFCFVPSDLIGEVEVLVSDLVLAQEQRLTLKLVKITPLFFLFSCF